jgi:hypothetical protein
LVLQVNKRLAVSGVRRLQSFLACLDPAVRLDAEFVLHLFGHCKKLFLDLLQRSLNFLAILWCLAFKLLFFLNGVDLIFNISKVLLNDLLSSLLRSNCKLLISFFLILTRFNADQVTSKIIFFQNELLQHGINVPNF